MNERKIRRELAKEGYRLVSKKDGYGVKMYSVVDMKTNCIVSGEFNMSLEDVENNWLGN